MHFTVVRNALKRFELEGHLVVCLLIFEFVHFYCTKKKNHDELMNMLSAYGISVKTTLLGDKRLAEAIEAYSILIRAENT